MMYPPGLQLPFTNELSEDDDIPKTPCYLQNSSNKRYLYRCHTKTLHFIYIVDIPNRKRKPTCFARDSMYRRTLLRTVESLMRRLIVFNDHSISFTWPVVIFGFYANKRSDSRLILPVGSIKTVLVAAKMRILFWMIGLLLIATVLAVSKSTISE